MSMRVQWAAAAHTSPHKICLTSLTPPYSSHRPCHACPRHHLSPGICDNTAKMRGGRCPGEPVGQPARIKRTSRLLRGPAARYCQRVHPQYSIGQALYHCSFLLTLLTSLFPSNGLYTPIATIPLLWPDYTVGSIDRLLVSPGAGQLLQLLQQAQAPWPAS